ncbi:MAG TPA: 50S ribosomal protein L25/general stress protein Ctc [Bacteroides sp.]|nr:50S ribosomal protein L25/general stress protein Ctc [Bacteroides sp.]
MKTFELKASLRKDTGKKESKNLRKQELVPCVIYGGEKIVHFAVIEKNFKNLIYTPDVFLVKLDIDGEKYDAVIQDIQFHPVSDRILHVDFSQVVDGKAVTINLPIELTGNSLGMLDGGKLRQRRRSLKVKGLAEHMPDYLEVDITSLDIGDSMKVGDLEYENLEVLDPQRAMVVGVVSSRLIAKGMQEAVVEEEEVIEEVLEGDEEAVAGEEGAPAAEEVKPEGE